MVVEVCYICQESVPEGEGVFPCNCVAPRHNDCMEEWIQQRRDQEGQVPTTCEVCRAEYRYEQVIVRRSKVGYYLYEIFVCIATFIANAALILLMGGHEPFDLMIHRGYNYEVVIGLWVLLSIMVSFVLNGTRLESKIRFNHNWDLWILPVYPLVVVVTLILFSIGVFARIALFGIDGPRYWSCVSLFAGMLMVAAGLSITVFLAWLVKYLVRPEAWRACGNRIIECCTDSEEKRVLATTRRVAPINPPQDRAPEPK